MLLLLLLTLLQRTATSITDCDDLVGRAGREDISKYWKLTVLEMEPINGQARFIRQQKFKTSKSWAEGCTLYPDTTLISWQ